MENKEHAGYMTAQIIAGMGPKTAQEALNLWDGLFTHIMNTIQQEPNPVVTIGTEVIKPVGAVIGQTQGGRRMPIVNQAEIQSKVEGAQRAIPVNKARALGIPEDAIEWAEKRGVTHLYDNRASQQENPKRPAFKAVNAEGFDIKTEDGRSLSYWGNRS